LKLQLVTLQNDFQSLHGSAKNYTGWVKNLTSLSIDKLATVISRNVCNM